MAEIDTKDAGAFRSARPSGGDLVDRYLAHRLRDRLFGGDPEVQLGRLIIDGVLGQGGMGAVLSAFDPSLDRHVAIKSVRPERGEENDKLLTEAKLLATVDHRAVVEVYDVITEEGDLHIVMERIDGLTLREWMADEHSADEVVARFVQLGDGLVAAHQRGIVHSDIKPENILIDGERAVLIDFGLAFHASEGSRRGGTIQYLAPERQEGGPGSEAADQYAFFTTLRETLESQNIPKRIARTIERGTADRPEERFASMADAVSALAPKRSARALWLTAAAAVVATGVAVTLAARDQASDPCENAAQSVEAAWSPATRGDVASAVGEAATERLDKYFAELGEARTSTCERTRVLGEQSDSFLDRASQCTNDRLRSAGSLVVLFTSEPPERVRENATQLVDGLEDIAGCTNAARLEQRPPLPADAEARGAIATLGDELESAKNQVRSGAFEMAASRLDDIVIRALALDYQPIVAEALLLRGAALETLGELDAAEVVFREAAAAASKAKDDRKLSETWIRLLELLAKRGKHDQVMALETVARASVERTPDAISLAARLHNTLGGIYLARADYNAAFASYQNALTLQREIGDEGNRALGPAIANLALVKWTRGDLEGAFADQKEALAVMIRELGPDHAHVAYTHQNVADIAQRLGPDEKKIAPHHFREALRIWTASLGEDHANLGYPLEQLANFDREAGEIEAAREKIQRALALRLAAYGPNHALVLQTMIGVIEIEAAAGTTASWKSAEETLASAQVMLDGLGDGGKRYKSYLSRAEIELRTAQGRWKKAAAIHRRTIAQTRSEFGEGPQLASAHASFGAFLMERDDNRRAAEQLELASDLYRRTAGPIPARINLLGKLATLAAKANNKTRAIEHLREAVSLATESSAPELGALRARLRVLEDS